MLNIGSRGRHKTLCRPKNSYSQSQVKKGRYKNNSPNPKPVELRVVRFLAIKHEVV